MNPRKIICFSFIAFFWEIVVLLYWFKGVALTRSIPQNETPCYGDSLVIGVTADASLFVPMFATDVISHEVAGEIFRGVVKFSPELKIVGDLARSFKVSPDGKEITFYLKKGIKWQDGVEVTARDIKFGFDLITNPKTPTAYASDFKEVKKFILIDNYTFKVIYKEPFALALMSWGNIVVLPYHLLKDKPLDYIIKKFALHPVGNGPFVFKEWKRGEKIVLKANPLYSEGRPYLNYLIYRIIPDPTTLFMELQNGGVDWISLSPLQYKKFKESPDLQRRFKAYKVPSFSYTYIGYNLKFPLFKNKLVRQALCHAINKTEVVKGALLGEGIPAYGPYKPGVWFYNKEVEKTCHYDPEFALKLFKKAGYVLKNGILVNEKTGKPFEFTLLTNQGNFRRLLAAQIIQYELSKIGIKMHIRVLEWTTLVNEFIMKRRFQAVLLGWATLPDPDLYDIFHSSKIKPPGLNFVSYNNSQVDRLLEEGRHTLDINKRKKIYFKLQKILAEDQPYTFLYIPMDIEVISRRFRGVKEAPIGIGYNLEKWWVPKNEQVYLVP